MMFMLAYLVEMKIFEKVFFVIFCYLDNTGCFSLLGTSWLTKCSYYKEQGSK